MASGAAGGGIGDATADAASACSRFAVFDQCPHCDGELTPEHAHFRCRACGWRDSCCD